jgi:type I restriction enzyme S subunit
LFAIAGATIGKCAMVSKKVIPANTNQALAILRLKLQINKFYVFHGLKSSYMLKYVIDNIAGGAQPNLNLEQIGNFKIPLPPLHEQTAIANALSDMDVLISQTEKLIEKKKAIKQGAMQELLKPKEGWVTKTLGEIGLISGAGVDKKIKANENAVRLLNYMDVYKRDFIYSKELNHWVSAPANKLYHCSVKQGDVFFTPSSETRTDIGLAAVAMEDISDAVYSYHVMRFRLLQDWDLKFRGYIFQTKNFLDQTEKMCEGGGKRYVLTMPKFRALLITYPESTIEQKKISSKLWDMDQELILLTTKLTKLKQQKQGMMQALLTGKIRLI